MKKLLTLIVFIFVAETSFGQCAMCKATVESNMKKKESNIGGGLNTGILYLMSVPYIAVGTIAFFWYRSSRKNARKRIKKES